MRKSAIFRSAIGSPFLAGNSNVPTGADPDDPFRCLSSEIGLQDPYGVQSTE
ncbi:hypothetical protein POX_b02959 [Penicillium oxalicum]|uniref:hypothetical protein n=1 Tax=Penicillium oxalicum TaxID=69781 RepID=UPI0020B7A867|nr:hypothetical protein POX_b02959 [Penicillium oxalicum]KAI2792915.1 hypothetical protein POX_b02959 [Penicillium oxalicum]